MARALETSGLDRSQAEGVANAFREAIEMSISDFATGKDLKRLEESAKLDLSRLEATVKTELTRVAGEQRTAIAEAANRQILWTVGTIFAAAGIALAIVKLT